MSVCPFCNKAVSQLVCPSCGRKASDAAAQSGYDAGGISLDDAEDPFADDLPPAALELDLPSRASSTQGPLGIAAPAEDALPNVVPDVLLPTKVSVNDLPPSLARHAGSAPVGSHLRAVTDDAAAIIARYPAAPTRAWEAPAYAMTVLWRQFELRQDLATLQKRRSPDVALYERALKCHDSRSFALGLTLTCGSLALAAFVFILPVILRFFRAPH